jgi:hypothetical protein
MLVVAVDAIKPPGSATARPIEVVYFPVSTGPGGVQHTYNTDETALPGTHWHTLAHLLNCCHELLTGPSAGKAGCGAALGKGSRVDDRPSVKRQVM